MMLRFLQLLRTFGVDPLRAIHGIRSAPALLRDYREFRRQEQASGGSFGACHIVPQMGGKSGSAGSFSGHYFHQDLFVARRILNRNPRKHVDVGSRIDGFVAHVACSRQIEVLDIRPLPDTLPNVSFRQCDVMALDAAYHSYCDSASSLHALEHFGLGRYGDPVVWDGHLRGLASLYDLLQPDGTLYLSVPIGPQRVEFNAHRVFSLPYMLGQFDGAFSLASFSFVDDAGDLQENVDLTANLISDNCGCQFGCGIFELIKTGD